MTLYYELEKIIEPAMSDFQMRHFVVDEQITPYRKLKQIILEMRARAEVKVMAELDRDEFAIKMKKAIRDVEKETDDLEKELKQLEVKRLSYHLDRAEARLKQVDSELTFFDTLLSDISGEFGGPEKIVEVLSNKEYRELCETEYWEHKFKRLVQGDFLNFGTISRGTFESLMSLSEDTANKIVSEALDSFVNMTQQIENRKRQLLTQID